MKKILVLAVVLAALFAVIGCGANQARLNFYTNFTGEKVVSVRTIYPNGDVPRDAVKMKSGATRIY